MEQIVSRKEEVKLASHLLEGISHDPSQVAHYLSRRRYQMDMDHDKAVSFDEGKAEGIIEGITKGKAEGKIDVVRAALAMALPLEQIERLTNLSREEIENLREGILSSSLPEKH